MGCAPFDNALVRFMRGEVARRSFVVAVQGDEAIGSTGGTGDSSEGKHKHKVRVRRTCFGWM